MINPPGQLPSVTISFNLLPGHSLGEAVDHIRALERELHMPASLTPACKAPPRHSRPLCRALGILLLIAVLVVYLVTRHSL